MLAAWRAASRWATCCSGARTRSRPIRPSSPPRCAARPRNAVATDPAEFDAVMRGAVADIVQRQVDLGIDVVSAGETSKISYSPYVHDRLTGFSTKGPTA